jgi:hypothetical protein
MSAWRPHLARSRSMREAHDCRGNDRDNLRKAARDNAFAQKRLTVGVRLRNVRFRKLVTSFDLTTVDAYSARLPPMPRLRRLSLPVEGCVRFDNDKCLFP